MILLSLIITLLYAFLLLSFIIGFDKVSRFKLKKTELKTNFSIIIPFRNEAENLPQLLDSLNNLDYPKELFEILMVDDESEDKSVEIIKKISIRVSILNNNRTSNSPKKDAITTAILKAKHSWIVTTDADCILPKKWLQNLNAFILGNKVEMVCGPVNYIQPKNFLERFQQLELMSLMSATIGGFGLQKPFMCNGANLAYSKALYEELNGFQGNNNIASGDDIFLLEKALNHDKSKVAFLKAQDSIVLTKPASSFKQMVQQRIRWASKSTHYKNGFGKLSGFLIFLMNALILILFVLSIFKLVDFFILLYFFTAKFLLDLFLMLKMATFFNNKKLIYSYPLCSLLYPFFSVFIVVNSVFTSYEWKGRHFRK